jgi:phosphohistidine phosphatase
MRILFIRHAEAVEADEFDGPDLKRPLTRAGEKSARKAFRTLARLIDEPDVLMCSEAVRARQTAKLAAAAFKMPGIVQSAKLNPGCSIKLFQKLLKELPGSTELVAVVGHEPDFSSIISELVARGRLDLDLRKGACAAVDVDGRRGRLVFAVSPDMLAH